MQALSQLSYGPTGWKVDKLKDRFRDRQAVLRSSSGVSLQRFSVARGQTREIAGVRDFRVCVGVDATAMGADCQPVAVAKAR